MDTSTLSSLDKDYDDGVYDKAHPPSKSKSKSKSKFKSRRSKTKRSRSKSPNSRDRASKLPLLMLVCLASLFVFSIIGTAVSGLYFNRRVIPPISITSTDCLGQSWIMFSSILGFLYIILHLQAARKGEPINRAQPPSQHPLHSATVVVARLDTIAWMVSLIIASVVVARSPTPLFYVNLVACSAMTPVITTILCVTEKAVRPFDLPYLTKSSTSSPDTGGVPTPGDEMPEVTTEDSISRRGSYAAAHHNSNRPNSHTQHAAAVAAANPGTTGAISGPRPPPSSVKEARPWAFTNFDNRTKTQLAASVNDASYASDMRARVGGPRPLADSDIAIKRGVLAPPVCSDPKVERLPERKLQKRPVAAPAPAPVHEAPARAASSSSAGGGAWRGDWTALKAETGYVTPTSSSTEGTPMSTPRVPLGVPLFSSRIASRPGALSPVVEVKEDKRSSGGSGSGSSGSGAASRPATAPAPSPAAPRVWTTIGGSQHTAPPASTATSSTAPRSVAGPRSQSLTYAAPPQFTTARYGRTLSYDSSGTLRPPPPTVTVTPATPAPAPATPAARVPATRVRLVRAQDRIQQQQQQQQQQAPPPPPQTQQATSRSSYETASLRRPQRLTPTTQPANDGLRTPEDDRLFFVNPPAPPRPNSNVSNRSSMLRMIPGSWRESI